MNKLNLNTALLIAVVFAFLSGAAVDAVRAAEKVVLQYRLTTQKTMHLDDEKIAKSYDQSLKNWVHPAKARAGLKKCGHAGLVWNGTKRFRQEKTACPQPCYMAHPDSARAVANLRWRR